MSVTLTEIFVIVVVCWTTREREIGEKCGCVRVLSATSPPRCPGCPAVPPDGGIVTDHLLLYCFAAVHNPVIHCQRQLMGTLHICLGHDWLLSFQYSRKVKVPQVKSKN